MANGIQCAERTVRGRRRRDGFRSARGGAVRKTNLTCGVHMSAREEGEGVTDGRRDSKKKAYYPEYAIWKVYFWKVFHKYYNFICAPICTKVLFLQKVGVTLPHPPRKVRE
jgi:hypothetical protein